MNPFLAGLGAGLQSAGKSAMDYLAQQQERKRQEDLKKEAEKKAQLALEQQLAQFAFQNNLQPMEQVESPIKRAEQIGSTFSSFRDVPGFGMGLGSAGDALSELAKQSRAEMAKGRTFSMPMSDGTIKQYYQPYAKTKEGMEAAERARSKQALKAAGFSDEESEAIVNSPEKMQSAILERIRPMPKGQPEKIVGPDGTVTFVQPPVMKPGERYEPGLKQNISMPGQAPYNWQTVTDPGTGTVYQVDPRSGQVRPTQAPDGSGPFQTTSSTQADAARARDRLRRAISRVRELVDAYGIQVMPGEQQDQLNGAMTNLQLQYKDAAGLGALTGPDMGLVEKALGDPTSVFQLLRGGKEGVLLKLQEAENALAGGQAPGTPNANPNANSNAPLTLSPQEKIFAESARRQGMSDAVIMDYIRKKRAGGGV